MEHSVLLPEPRVLISLCTFNERDNISEIIPELRSIAPHADIVVVDDNSPDGTWRLVEELQRDEAQGRLHLIHRRNERGLGTAMVAAFRFAIEQDYDLLLTMDADFSHPPRFLQALLEAAPRADVVIGSRYVSGGATPGWGIKRRLMSWGINTYARLMLGLKTRDNSGAFRCYRVARLRELPLQRVRARGYAFQEEILFRLKQIGCSFDEVPITFEERRFGVTKINWREAVAALWLLACLPWERNPKTARRHEASQTTT